MSGAVTDRRGILCGVDGSSHARHAADAARALASRLGAKLTLVHVAQTQTLVPVATVPADADPSAYTSSRAAAEVKAKEVFAALSPEVERAEASREVHLGEPATVLAERADESGAELIVVGSRRQGAWRSAALGSVSSELVRLAPCPVLIVPDDGVAAQQTA
jgi:nucleotide-binding universal stress UspA family protein